MPRVRRTLPLVLLLLLLLGGGGAVALLSDDRPAPGGALDEDAAAAMSDDGAAQDSGRPGQQARAPHRTARARVAARPTASDGANATDPNAPSEAPDGSGGATADAPEGGEEPAQESAVAADEERTTVRGRVVDSATGEVLADARVLVARPKHGWYGTRSDDEGAFEGLAPEDPGDGSGVEVRIAKPGYHTLVVPWEDGELDVQLVPRDHLPMPGVVEGLATDAAGHALSGRILLSTYDEMGDHHGLWAWADQAGAFRLEGLAPGWWQMRLAGGSKSAEVVVPNGGSGRVHVVGGAEPWPGSLTAEEFAAKLKVLSSGRPAGVTDEALSDDQRQAVAWQRSLAVQDLESRWRAVRPTRPLVVTGLPTVGVAHLRAASTQGPNHSWRVPIVDGVARFPALTEERWRLILQVPGAPAAAHDVQIPERNPDDPAETETVDYAWPSPEPPDDR